MTGGTTTQLVPNSNSVTFSLAAAPTGNCSGASAGGTTVSCVRERDQGHDRSQRHSNDCLYGLEPTQIPRVRDQSIWA
jgi:hypothetical protein